MLNTGLAIAQHHSRFSLPLTLLLASLLGAQLTFGAPSAAFDDYDSANFEAIADLPLPDKILMPVSKQMGAKIHQEAHGEFSREVDFEFLITVTENAASDGKVAREVFLRAKAMRKVGLRLRATYNIFSKQHTPPKMFETFMKRLGHFNDAVETGSSSDVRKMAKKLAESIRPNAIAAEVSEIDLVSKDEITRFITDELNSIRAVLEKSEVKIEQFHDVRKSLKNFIGLPKNADANAYLLQINDELGVINDKLIELDLDGEVDYDDEKIKLKRPLKRCIQKFIERLEVES